MSNFSHYRVTNREQVPILSDSTPPLDAFKIKLLSLTKDEIVFDLIGVDASVANALRRILLAEVEEFLYHYILIK